MLDIEFAEATDCGPVRPHNEDFVGHSLPGDEAQARARGWIFTLADGVGGLTETAARIFVTERRHRRSAGAVVGIVD